LEILTGLPRPESVSVIQSTGTKLIVIKKKGAGAVIVQGAKTWDLPAEIIRAKDMTGAGDVFAAGFLAGLLKGQSLPDCGHLGLRLARQSMTGLGSAAYPGKEDLEMALNLL
jgi:sugar/nucleoside kinase (ribokinase family)